MSKLAAIICVAFLASATHGFWLRDAEEQLYRLAEIDAEGAIVGKAEEVESLAEKTIANIEKVGTDKTWMDADTIETIMTKIQTRMDEESKKTPTNPNAKSCLDTATAGLKSAKLQTKTDIETCMDKQLAIEKNAVKEITDRALSKIKSKTNEMLDCRDSSGVRMGFVSGQACYSGISQSVREAAKEANKKLNSLSSLELKKKVKDACNDIKRAHDAEKQFFKCLGPSMIQTTTTTPPSNAK